MSTNESTKSDDLARLFVELTGETTLTEQQLPDDHGVIDGEGGQELTEDLRNDGLNDALAEPDVG
ncbi:hypothetical protein [Haloarchaeobius sp. DFWS5]|uniref:hypothetical protein n=1 Tax=Haloarchaeobius sp. DFWS5 TaxID=3446114 RepID=UPI003EBBEBE4